VAFIALQFVPMSSAYDAGKRSTNIPKATTAINNVDSIFAPIANIHWEMIANNACVFPNTEINFSSYGQPAVNSKGMVVFRGRSTGGNNRETGIYMKQTGNGPILDGSNLRFLVPYPNNLDETFKEFPAVPRISMNATNIATRGIHKPVYRYFLPDGSETRAGTTGIYAQLEDGLLVTGASKLGAVPGFEYYAVPGVEPSIPFDVFPGAPAITDDGTVVFKGNYTVDGVGKTGIFYRSLLNTPGGGTDPVQVIATSDSDIPNAPPSFRALTFDSTAPPTVAGNEVVFVGLDNEDNPHFGGIYIAETKQVEPFRTLIGLGEPLPGLPKIALKTIGEGLSYDGRYLAFWGSWGNATKNIRLNCPVDGNSDIVAYCNGVDPNSVYDERTGVWYQIKQVPVNQGIFVYDKQTEVTFLVADTVSNFDDFVFWGYSGKAPGTGPEAIEEEEEEPPRWRSAAFTNVSDGLVAFKSRTGLLDSQGNYVNPVDGIYLGNVMQPAILQVVLETGMDGSEIDPMLPPNEMLINGLGIERDGFRGRYLAITATMANAEESWGGVYLGHVSGNQPINKTNIKEAKAPGLRKLNK